MSSWLAVAADQITALATGIKADVRRHHGMEADVQMNFMCFRDDTDYTDWFQTYNTGFTNDIAGMSTFIRSMRATGGGDLPEDVTGAMKTAASMPWSAQARFFLLVSDAPCHGEKYQSLGATRDNYPDGNEPSGLPEPILNQLKAKKVHFLFSRITSQTDIMIEKFRNTYDDRGFKNT